VCVSVCTMRKCKLCVHACERVYVCVNINSADLDLCACACVSVQCASIVCARVAHVCECVYVCVKIGRCTAVPTPAHYALRLLAHQDCSQTLLAAGPHDLCLSGNIRCNPFNDLSHLARFHKPAFTLSCADCFIVLHLPIQISHT